MKTLLRSPESGFTLVELIIYSALAVVVLAIIGGIFLNGLTGERIVRDVTQATSQGQLVVESVERGVRNSDGLRISTPNDTDAMLVARTAVTTGAYDVKCVAWYYSAAEHTLKTTEAATMISAEPTESERATWLLLVEGVDPIPGEPMFSQGGKTVTFQFQVDAGDQDPVTFASTATSRAETLEAAPCS